MLKILAVAEANNVRDVYGNPPASWRNAKKHSGMVALDQLARCNAITLGNLVVNSDGDVGEAGV